MNVVVQIDGRNIVFQDLGLSIDGEEQVVNKNKSYVSISGRDFHSVIL